MIIWVDDTLFEDQEARDIDRLALLRNAAMRGHVLTVSSSPGTLADRGTSELFESWRSELSSPLREEVTQLIDRLRLIPPTAVTYGTDWLLVSNEPPRSDVSDRWVTLKEAIRTAALPLFMLVENIVNDAAFLRRVLPPRWSKRFDEWERSGQLCYEHGGGSDIPKIITRFTEDSYCRQAFGLPARIWIALHFVLCDHDGPKASEPGQLARDVEKAFKKASMDLARFHRLERRKQESYLPRRAVQAIVALDEHVPDPSTAKTEMDAYFGGKSRSFSETPSWFKNRFDDRIPWAHNWFEDDGAWPEFTRLAERIAAAM